MRKIELFFRGEFWLHLATMFFFTSLLIKIVELPIYVLIIVIIITAFVWELFWKFKRGSKVDIYDITATVIGGLLSVFLL